MKNKILFLGFIVLVLALAGGVWVGLNKQDQDQPNDNSGNKAIEEESNSSNSNELDSKDIIWYEVPELEIKFPVNEELKEDLIYSLKEVSKHNRKVAYFSLKSIENRGELCNVDDGPLGALAKVNGKFKQGDFTYGCIGGFLAKEFNDFFLCFSGPQAPTGCLGEKEETGWSINDYIPLDKIERL